MAGSNGGLSDPSRGGERLPKQSGRHVPVRDDVRAVLTNGNAGTAVADAQLQSRRRCCRSAMEAVPRDAPPRAEH